MTKPLLDSNDDFRSGCRNVSYYNGQQSFSQPLSPERSDNKSCKINGRCLSVGWKVTDPRIVLSFYYSFIVVLQVLSLEFEDDDDLLLLDETVRRSDLTRVYLFVWSSLTLRNASLLSYFGVICTFSILKLEVCTINLWNSAFLRRRFIVKLFVLLKCDIYVQSFYPSSARSIKVDDQYSRKCQVPFWGTL